MQATSLGRLADEASGTLTSRLGSRSAVDTPWYLELLIRLETLLLIEDIFIKIEAKDRKDVERVCCFYHGITDETVMVYM